MTEQLKSLATEEQIDARVKEMATEIIERWGDDAPLFVGLLRGAAPFTSKLMFEIARQAPEFHPELDYMTLKTYRSGRTAGKPQLIHDIDSETKVEGRTVIALDDVLDKGPTAEFVQAHFRQLGAAAFHLVVLVQKDVVRQGFPAADIYGFKAPDKWLVGMGMDNADLAPEAFRWDGSMYAVEHE